MAPASSYLTTLVEDIKEETDHNKSISKLADIVLAMDGGNGKRHTEINEKVDKLSVAILGNGHPEDAILTRVCRLEKWQKWLLGICGFIGTSTGGYILLQILSNIK